MATPVLCCGFECGVSGSAGMHLVTRGGTTPTFVSSPVRVFAGKALNCKATAGTSFMEFARTGVNVNAVRFYVYFNALPSADSWLFCTGILINNTYAGVRFKQSDGKLYPSFLNGTQQYGSVGLTVVTGVWYRIDILIDTHANPWTVDLQIDGVAFAQFTTALAAGTQNRQIIGHTETATVDTVYDDLLWSETTGDYPLGQGFVQSFVPNADGTHTATTTTIVKGTAATPVGANVAGNTDSFGWVNGRPIGGGASDATRLVNQQTLGTTLYAEWQFEHYSGSGQGGFGPRAVDIMVVDQQASTAAGDMHIKLNDNGTENVILDRTNVAGVITDRYTTKQYATMVGGGAWTLARFNGLRVRFGYSADATPDQYCRGIMIEAEFQEEMPQGLQGIPFGIRGQRQQQQLMAL